MVSWRIVFQVSRTCSSRTICPHCIHGEAAQRAPRFRIWKPLSTLYESGSLPPRAKPTRIRRRAVRHGTLVVSMHQKLSERFVDLNPQETAEWTEALAQVLDDEGPDRAAYLLEQLTEKARAAGAELPIHLNTPYVNTIRPEDEVAYPGDRAIERRIKSLIRWNAMAMVVRQNKYDAGIGGHISTYASLATLLEVGFNHFFHAK